MLGEFPQAIAPSSSARRGWPPCLPPMTRAAGAGRRPQAARRPLPFHRQARGGLASARCNFATGLIREQPSDQDARFQPVLATVNLGNYGMGLDPNTAIARYREALARIAGSAASLPRIHAIPSGKHGPPQPGTDPPLGTGKTEAAVAASARRLPSPRKSPMNSYGSTRWPCAQQPGRSPGESQASRRGRDIFGQALNDYRPWQPFPQRRGLPMGRGMALSNLAAVDAPARPPKDSARIHRGVETGPSPTQEVTGHQPGFQKHYVIHTSIRDAIGRSPEPKGP